MESATGNFLLMQGFAGFQHISLLCQLLVAFLHCSVEGKFPLVETYSCTLKTAIWISLACIHGSYDLGFFNQQKQKVEK